MQETERDGDGVMRAPAGGTRERLESACDGWERRGNPDDLARWLVRELDHDGSPKRLSVEEWGPCLDRLGLARDRRDGWPDGIRERVEGLFAWLVHAGRPDGSSAFGPKGRERSRADLLRGWAARAADPAFASVVGRWFPDTKGPKRPPVPPPLPSISDDDRVLAVLRPDWTAGGDWIAIDHRAKGDEARVELAGDGRILLGATWRSDGLAGPVGTAKPTSWSTGAYADALEWTFRAGPLRVTRTAVLLRYRRVAILAQQEDGPATSAAMRIGLAPGTTPAAIPDLRAWSLTRSRLSARLIPLALPALPYATDRGSFRVAGGEAVLEQAATGPRRWLPLVVTWGRNPVHWRTLTVTERSRPCPPQVAFGARLSWGVGEEGLLVYRSLVRPALRVVLGHQTRARFLVGRFTPEGNVVPLIELD